VVSHGDPRPCSGPRYLLDAQRPRYRTETEDHRETL